MALLWHDSFSSYTTSGQLGENYPNVSGTIAYRQEGRRPAAVCLRAEQATFRTLGLQSAGAGPGEDTLIMGFWVKLPDLDDSSRFLGILTTGSLEQIRVRYRKRASEPGFYYFEIVRMVSNQPEEVILRTKRYQQDVWYFFELKIIFAQGGVVQWRTGGNLEISKQNVQTEETGQSRGWVQVLFDFVTPVSSGEFSFLTDLYILNTENATTEPRFSRFLGTVTCSTLYPDPEIAEQGRIMEWQNAGPPDPKFRFVVLAGQSNMDGFVTALNSALPGSIRNPNGLVYIWDPFSGVMEPLNAETGTPTNNSNNARHLESSPENSTYHGPEMSLAEEIADYYEQTPANTSSPLATIFIKAAQNNSSLYINNPGFSWMPLSSSFPPGGNAFSLYNGNSGAWATQNLKKFIDDAANSSTVGNWSNVERVDFIWYQGETDAFDFGPLVGTLASTQYFGRMEEFFQLIRDDINTFSSGNARVHFHITQIHKDLVVALENDPGFKGFIYKDTIRQAHRNYAAAHADVSLIDVDSIPLAPDGTHYEPAGYQAIGQKFFQSWLAQQPFASYIDDYKSGSLVSIGINVFEDDKDALFKWSGTRWLRNSEILATRHEARGKTWTGTNTDVRVLFANAVSEAADSTNLTFTSTSDAIKRAILLRSPLDSRVILEDQLQSYEIGFRSF